MRCRAARTLLLLLGSGLAVAADGVWLDIPFVKQSKDGCGAASLAMVMQYWAAQQSRPVDESADPDRILDALYSRQGHGIYASRMQQYIEQHGFRAFAFRGDWDLLKQHLLKGRPLVVALRPTSSAAALHYVVVAGFDGNEKLILLNDPAQRKLLKQDRSSFEREWKATEQWTLLAVPQSEPH